MGSLVERCGQQYALSTAVVHEGQRISHGEQIRRIRRSGRALRSLGLAPGDRVGILMTDRPELLDVYYGAMWAGLAVVPLGAKLSAEDQDYILRDSGARVLVTDRALAERAETVRDAVEIVASVHEDAVPSGGRGFGKLTGAESDGPGMPEVSPDDLLGIYYTGGTTGRPKGAVHTHRTFIASLISEMLEFGLGERDTFAHVAPLTHSSGCLVLPVWLRGGSNVILGGFDPGKLIDTIERERVSATMLVPTMLYVLLDQMPDSADMSSLSTIVYGASPIGRERLLQGIDRFGPIFTQLYGQTEAPNQITVLSKGDHAAAIDSGEHDLLSSCGRPVAIADVRVATDDLADVEPGAEGEIVARGPHVMLRYWNRPEETEKTLRDGWLRTGDVARADENGFLYIVDRKKDMIISGGFNVYPKEVEQTLFSHPAVRDVCVIGVPDDKWGEAVKAVVVPDPEAGVGADDLVAWVKERKGSVLAPKSVDFTESIPLTAVGKHDKPALRKEHWGGQERRVN
jgi:fatty-acyl-CoA synthase